MHSCRQCGHSCETVKGFLGHYRTHLHEPNCVFQCDVSKCKKTFRGFQTLKTHIIRSHLYKYQQNRHNSESLPSRCSVDLCNKTFESVKALIKHLNAHFENGTTVGCPFSNCNGSFHMASSFRSHLSRRHQNYTNEKVKAVNCPSEPHENASDVEIPEDFEQEANAILDGVDSSELELDETNIEHEYHKYLTKFYLKFESKLLVPSSTIQEMSDDMKVNINFENDQKKKILRNELQNSGLTESKINPIIDNVFESDLFGKAHDKQKGPFRSIASRKIFYKHNTSYVEPEEIYLGRSATHKPCYAHYVPIKGTLKNLLQDPNVRAQYLSPRQHIENKFCDISDGNAFQNNALFKEHPSALRIILYQDAYEIVNPLGSAKKKHKILGVYFSLANIYPENRSKIDTIQLALLCRDSDLNHFGQNAVFQRLVYDLKALEEGIDLGLDEPIYGTIACIVGDNLGSHSLGGFTENFSTAEFFCRYCHAGRSHLEQATLNVETQEMRTPGSYAMCTDHLNDNPDEPSFKGIKFNSLFNTLQYFHVCSPGLPPCLGHDLFEGVVKYDVRLMLNSLIREGWFTLTELNRMIETFPYKGDDAKNKPCTIAKASESISGQAVENWNMVRFLPLIISIIAGEAINVSNPAWTLLLILQQIIEIVTSHELESDDIAVLDMLIKDYLDGRASQYPGKRLRPKHHYIAHYPLLISMFGPLIHVWSMRFESKHSYFKECIRHSKNFKNVTKTLSHKHQLLQAYYGTGSLICPAVVVDQAVALDLDLFNDKIKTAVLEFFPRNPCMDGISVVTTVTVSGITYKKKQILHVGNTDVTVLLGEILLVLCDSEQKVFFVTQVSNYRQTYLRTYTLHMENETTSVVCIQHSDLKSKYPLNEYRGHILPKYILRKD